MAANYKVSHPLRTGTTRLLKPGSLMVGLMVMMLMLVPGNPSQDHAAAAATVLDKKIYIPLVMKGPATVTVALRNGNFEAGPGVGWAESSTNVWPVVVDSGYLMKYSDVVPRSGNYAAWLGGGDDESSYIEQSVTISSGAPYLIYYYQIDSLDRPGFDTASVRANNTEVKKYDLSLITRTKTWVRDSINLSAYAGKTIALQFRADINNNGDFSSLFIDDVSFSSSP